MTDLVKIEFHGDELECLRNNEGVWVSLRRVCEAVGIDYKNQHEKLKQKAWATMVLSTTTGSDGKKYQMSMLHLDSLPMWLATIDAERVSDEARPKIELYQRECAKALRDFWFKGEAKRPKPKEAKSTLRDEAYLLNAKTRLYDLQRKALASINAVTRLAPEVYAATEACLLEVSAGQRFPALKPSTLVEWYTAT